MIKTRISISGTCRAPVCWAAGCLAMLTAPAAHEKAETRDPEQTRGHVTRDQQTVCACACGWHAPPSALQATAPPNPSDCAGITAVSV